jgi:hypothetical protein
VSNRDSNQIRLGMGRWIPIRLDRVLGGQDDTPVENQKRAEWVVACQSSLASQFDRLLQKLFVDRFGLHFDFEKPG